MQYNIYVMRPSGKLGQRVAETSNENQAVRTCDEHHRNTGQHFAAVVGSFSLDGQAGITRVYDTEHGHY